MRLFLSALDTWFFRDTTPFTKDASPQAGVVSLFPPHPPTVTGAVRAALARANGWDGARPWSADLKQILGDGPEQLGQLRFTGPFIARNRGLLFAVPQHVIGHTDEHDAWHPDALLILGDEIECDLGRRQLPIPDRRTESRPRPAASHRITPDGLAQILRGELPSREHLVHESTLWKREPRVGIARETGSRTTKDGALYSTHHIRPVLHQELQIAIDVNGVPPDWPTLRRAFVPLGGESRLAVCELAEPTSALGFVPPALAIDDSRVLLVALTPLLLDADVVLGKAPLPELDAYVLGACSERPLRIGGWDSRTHEPLRLRNALPAGSTLFCALHDRAQFHAQLRNGLLSVGDSIASGFGLCATARIPHRPHR
jgi:CRISPR-associated protein Cmr3